MGGGVRRAVKQTKDVSDHLAGAPASAESLTMYTERDVVNFQILSLNVKPLYSQLALLHAHQAAPTWTSCSVNA